MTGTSGVGKPDYGGRGGAPRSGTDRSVTWQDRRVELLFWIGLVVLLLFVIATFVILNKTCRATLSQYDLVLPVVIAFLLSIVVWAVVRIRHEEE